MPSGPVPGTHRVAARVVQVGALAVVLASLPYKAFDLDRYFVPKELVLHTCAALAAVLCLAHRTDDGRIRLSLVDLLLLGFLLVSLASAVLAPNVWLAQRAMAISFSGVALFWVGRELARSGLQRSLVVAVGVAVVVAACTTLLQAYGVKSEYFSLNRMPGGTFGNRNFAAHLCAIGVPALVYTVFTARRGAGALLGTIGLALVAAALVLSRSRAAWLAILVLVAVTALLPAIARRPWWPAESNRRLLLLTVGATVGVLGAAFLPNTLDWNSESPYLDSAAGLVNYKEGSGHGRLIQYHTSLKILRAHPVLGVGPGNWPVSYPSYATRGDPSMSAEDGMTANPWPSSDWVATLSERGVIAGALLACAIVALGWSAVATLRGRHDAGGPEGALSALALVGTIVVAAVVGSFDAVLLIAAPTLIFWSLVGALAVDSVARPRLVLASSARVVAVIVLVVFGVLSIGRNGREIGAMAIVTNSSRASALEAASQLDPGNYRIHLRLAESYAGQGSCSKARVHADAAHALFPSAGEPRRVLARCR